MKKNKIGNLVWLGGFYDGFARFDIIKDGMRKCGLINQHGDVMIPPLYDSIRWSEKYIWKGTDFQDEGIYYTRYYKGLENGVDVCTELGYDEDVQMEYYTARMLDVMSGKLIDAGYEYPSGGGGFHVSGEGGKEGIIDKEGNIIIPYNYRTLVWCERFYIAEDLAGKWGLLNATGEIILPFVYDCIYYEAKHSNLPYAPELYELIPVRQGEHRFYINATGMRMSPYEYDYIEPFSNNMYAVFGIKKNGIIKYGVIDSRENIVVPPKYDNCRLLGDVYVLVKGDVIRSGMTEWVDTLCGVVDLQNRVVLPIQYDEISLAPDHAFIVFKTCHNGRRQYDFLVGVVRPVEVDNLALQVNNGIQIIIPLEYTGIFVCGSVYVAQQAVSELWGVLSPDGEVIVPFVYDDIEYSGTSEFIPVEQNGEWFYINSRNERVLF